MSDFVKYFLRIVIYICRFIYFFVGKLNEVRFCYNNNFRVYFILIGTYYKICLRFLLDQKLYPKKIHVEAVLVLGVFFTVSNIWQLVPI